MALRAHMRAALLALTVFAGLPGAAPAQQDGGGALLIIDQEELFLRSRFGQRIREDIAAASRELAAENRSIETALVAEEQDLTERRETMANDEFRILARAFDEKVVAIRAEQDAKGRAIARTNDEAQQAFFARVAEILGEIMRERGAVAILDQRVVFLSSDQIDITDLAVSRIDAAIGDGSPIIPDLDDTQAPQP